MRLCAPKAREVGEGERTMIKLSIALLTMVALCSSCGGGGDAIPAAHAQPAPTEVAYLHFALRPDSQGRWFVQDDSDHASVGVASMRQTQEYLEVTFDRRYTHAGAIVVSSDDDFRDRVSGYCNLGVDGTRCRIVAGGREIDPATVRDVVPLGHRPYGEQGENVNRVEGYGVRRLM